MSTEVVPAVKIPPYEKLLPIPRFPDYALEEGEHNVWRVKPSARGARCGEVFMLKPRIHPRGQRFHVSMTHDTGKRYNIAVAEIVYAVTGETLTRFGQPRLATMHRAFEVADSED